MKLFTIILMGIVFSSPTWAGETYTVEVVKQPLQKWHFQRLSAISVDGGMRVMGRMTASNRFGLRRGHIDIAVISPNGEVIAKTTVDHTPSLLSRKAKRRGGVRFSSKIDAAIPSGSIVRVAFHRKQPAPHLTPTHDKSVAL